MNNKEFDMEIKMESFEVDGKEMMILRDANGHILDHKTIDYILKKIKPFYKLPNSLELIRKENDRVFKEVYNMDFDKILEEVEKVK